VIGGTIRVVVSIKGNTVRLGVAARPDVIVDRAEVHAQRQEFTAVEVVLV
jgi:sRNA-binding carbon storage regulator CsrA